MKKPLKSIFNPKPRALTRDIQCAIRERILSGKPLMSRHSKYLLLDGYKISRHTYSSWKRRGYVPTDAPSAQSLDEVVAKAQQRADLRYLKDEIVLGNQKVIQQVFRMSNSTTISSKITASSFTQEREWIFEPDVRVIKLKYDAARKILGFAWA